MSSRSLIVRNPANMLHASAPALNGDEVAESLGLQARLTNEALRHRRSICQILFPSALTKDAYSARLGRPFRQHPATRSRAPGRDRSAATGSLAGIGALSPSAGTLG